MFRLCPTFLAIFVLTPTAGVLAGTDRGAARKNPVARDKRHQTPPDAFAQFVADARSRYRLPRQLENYLLCKNIPPSGQARIIEGKKATTFLLPYGALGGWKMSFLHDRVGGKPDFVETSRAPREEGETIKYRHYKEIAGHVLVKEKLTRRPSPGQNKETLYHKIYLDNAGAVIEVAPEADWQAIKAIVEKVVQKETTQEDLLHRLRSQLGQLKVKRGDRRQQRESRPVDAPARP